ncbi:MAG TPA: FAD-dependent oxidoreductase [Casimicrobiaceae bacterium]|nr:FAD-dependent oxidoreductase [Casimicrobiaceae bacterium]
MNDPHVWDREVDLLVCGAGAGGMSAAIVAAQEGLEVLVCEKTSQVGGTTATSGGAIWVPGNHLSRTTAAPDTTEAGRRYLDQEVGTYGDPQVREAFLQHGPAALEYLERHSEVKLKSNHPYPDYHAEKPGGALGGRTCAPLPFDGRRLGADFALLRPPMPEFMVLGGMMVGRDEIKHLVRPWRSWPSFKLALRLVAQYVKDRLTHARGTRLLLGNALAGRLLYSLRQKGVEIMVDAPLVELVRERNDVIGALVDVAGKRTRIRARRGVVLATGGCAASARWRAAEVKDRAIPHALALEGASGDGLDAGIAAGGAINRNHSTPFFWMPASIMRWPDGRVATYPHIRDRPKPGLIAVNAAGKRFVNEGNSYHDFVAAMFDSDESVRTIPAYLVCDRDFVRDYGLGVVHPVWQWLPKYLRAGYLVSASTLEELAQSIGVDPQGLVESIDDHNRAAREGVDRAFGKGSLALNRHNGDPDNKPNPCLRPIVRAPFFALAVHPAPLGSSVGLHTNAHAQVLDEHGNPIAGLYACGNDMSSVMGGAYPGPGITLGPALVFGYCAAMHAAGKAVAQARLAA